MKKKFLFPLLILLFIFGIPIVVAQVVQQCGLFNQACWTTTNRPINPSEGTQGFNLTFHLPEFWTGSAWAQSGAPSNFGAVFPTAGSAVGFKELSTGFMQYGTVISTITFAYNPTSSVKYQQSQTFPMLFNGATYDPFQTTIPGVSLTTGVIGIQGVSSGVPVTTNCSTCMPGNNNGAAYSPTSPDNSNLPVGGAVVSAKPTYTDGQGSPFLINSVTDGLVIQSAEDYPAFSTPLNASTTGTTGSIAATLTALATGKTAYICGIELSSSGATGISSPTVTISGLTSTTLNYVYPVVAIANNNQVPLIIPFKPCRSASAINTNIVATLNTGIGAGGTAAAINIAGYLK